MSRDDLSVVVAAERARDPERRRRLVERPVQASVRASRLRDASRRTRARSSRRRPSSCRFGSLGRRSSYAASQREDGRRDRRERPARRHERRSRRQPPVRSEDARRRCRTTTPIIGQREEAARPSDHQRGWTSGADAPCPSGGSARRCQADGADQQSRTRSRVGRESAKTEVRSGARLTVVNPAANGTVSRNGEQDPDPRQGDAELLEKLDELAIDRARSCPRSCCRFAAPRRRWAC